MLATVASINSANRLKARLSEKFAVPARVMQTPSALTKEGCGYSIKFENSHKSMVEKCARELHINIRSFFREETKSGETVYIKE